MSAAPAASQRVLLADDHIMFRQSLRGLLEREGFNVVAEAGDGREAVLMTQAHDPDLAILDLAMPLLDGPDAAQEIARIDPGIRTILLTMHSEEPYIAKALQAGIRGYVLKTQATTDLMDAIRQVSQRNREAGRGDSRIGLVGVLAGVIGPAHPHPEPGACPFDPFDLDVLWHEMFDTNRVRGHGAGFLLGAISALDIADMGLVFEKGVIRAEVRGKELENPAQVRQLLMG